MEQQRNIAATKLVVRHYWRQMKQDWRLSLPAMLLPAVGSVLVFYVPALIVAQILTKLNSNTVGDLSNYLGYIVLFIIVWGSGELLWRIGIHFLIRVEANGVKRLYINAMNDLFEKDLAFFHNNFAGSLTKKLNDYANRYVVVNDTLAFNVIASYLPIIFAAIILWFYSVYLVIALVGLIVVTGFIIYPLIIRRQKLVAVRETASNKVSGYVADMVGNIDAIKGFANEAFETSEHQRNVLDYTQKMKKSWDYQNRRIDSITSPLSVLTNTTGLVIAIFLGTHTGANPAIVFVAFSYYSTVARVMWEFNHVYRSLESSITAAGQFTELLLDEPKITDIAKPQPFRASGGAIMFENVHFRYDDSSGQHLFQSINLAIKAGEKVALVGHSGSGKTTITKLLLRYMDIDSGTITIDGSDISQVSQRDLRGAIAYVPQEPIMFHRSLADNIRYGKLSASDAEIKTIAKLAHADDFICQLEKGYETLVGERGIKLSGGQRQRIAIARAMIKDAPILLLDEATSALDSESEKYIQDALWKLMEGRTAIIVAHRLSTIQKMDRIIVLEDGAIAEDGSHAELLKHEGIYAKLWAHQSGGFLED